MKPRRNLFLGSLLVVALTQVSPAGSLEWSGSSTGLASGSTDIWDTNATANWWDGLSLVSWPALGGTDDDAVFGGTAGTVTIDAGGVTVNDITFTTTGYTLSGGGITLNGTTPTITNGTGIDATISSVISGSDGLTKAGGGILTLSGANDYTGVTTISAGILKAGNGAALGASGLGNGTIVSSGASLDINGQNLGLEEVTISGTGAGGNGAIINSGGTQINALRYLTLGADASIGGPNRWDLRNTGNSVDLAGFTLTKTGGNYIALVGTNVTPGAGNIIINEGELNLSTSTTLNGSASNSITVNNGGTLGFYQSSSAHAWTLNLNTGSTVRGENGSSSQNNWAGAVNANGNFTLLAENGHNVTLSGGISGSGNLEKTGLGTGYLSGDNSSWSGGITITAGSLQVNAANSLGTSTSITTSGADNAALVLGDGVTAGSGKSVTVAGGGASQFFGALSTSGSATWEGDVVIGAATGTRIGTLGSGTLTISGDISETASSALLFRPNGGTVRLTGNNSYTGTTTIGFGTLQIGSANALGPGDLEFIASSTVSSDGATARNIANNLVFSADTTLGNATNNGKLTFGGTTTLGATRTLTVNSEVEFTNAIGSSGAFGITKAGSADLILSGNNTFSGSVTVNAGKLVASHANALGAAGKTINVSTGGTLELANDAVVPNYTFNTGSSSSGVATIILNRATPGAALSQDITSYLLGNSIITFEAGANVTSGTPTVNIGSATYTAGATGAGYTKLNPNGVNLNIGSLTKTGSQSAVRLGGTSTGNIITGVVSNGSGAYSITKEDSGTWELAGVNTYTGSTTVSDGKLVLSGNRVASSGGIDVGNAAGKTGILDITGDLPMGGNALSAGLNADGATGIINQSAGLVSFTSGNALLIGRTVGGVSGTYNLSGGELRTFASSSRGIMIGVNAGSSGNLIDATFNLSGTGNLNNPGSLQVVRGDSSSGFQNSTYNQTGGTSTNGYLRIGGSGGNGANSIATFSVTGGTFSASSFQGLSAGNDVVSTMTIGGTADVTLPAFPTARGTNSTATLNFDGGVLKPTASSTAYLGGLTNAYIQDGGATFDTSGFDITVSQDLLEDSGSTGGGLTKTGNGTLTLTGANTYTGGTTISTGFSGIIQVTSDSNLGDSSGGVIFSGNNTSALVMADGFSSSRALTLVGNSNTEFRVAAGETATWNGTIDFSNSGGTQIRVQNGAGGTMILKGAASNADSAGNPIVLAGGNLVLDSGFSLSVGGAGAGNLLLGRSTVASELTAKGSSSTSLGPILLNSGGSSPSATLNIQDTATLTGTNLDLNNNGATSSVGVVNLDGGTLTIDSVVKTRNGATQTAVFNFNGGTLQAGASSTTFWSSLSGTEANVKAGGATIDTNGHDITIAQSLLEDSVSTGGGLTKSGSGTLTLSGTSSYTGATNVNAGTLVVDGNISTSTLTTVGENGTLAGSGTVGATIVSGMLAPGNSPGTLNIAGDLGLNDTATLAFEFNPFDMTVGGGFNDLVSVTGNLTLDGTLNVTGGDFSSIISGSWRLFDYTGSLTDNGLILGSMPTLASGYSWEIDTAVANQVNLTVIPEPRAAVLGLFGLLALMRRRRA